MADLTDKTDDIAIWNEGRTKAVTVSTDGAKERLDVSTKDDLDVAITNGNAYSHADIHTLGNNVTYYHLLIVPNTATRIRFSFNIASTGPVKVQFYEAPTTTANGTAADEINRDRNSVNVASMTMFQDPTVTVDGTLLQEFSLGATGGAKAGATETRVWVLKQNTKYLVKLISGQASNEISTELFWVEV